MARRSPDSKPAASSLRTAATRLPLPLPDYALETERLSRGLSRIAGLDEVGRGPLAGPVVAAAVVLDGNAIPDGLNDSKKLTAGDRERIMPEILRFADVSIAFASAGEIDAVNIRQATFLAMLRAVAGLSERPCHVLIDGRDVPHPLLSTGSAIVGGDARSVSIAAASIVAKVVRDRMMTRLCRSFPAYGFGRHMGYATAEHLAALTSHGPCIFHRFSFRPIRPDDPLLL